MTREWQIKVGEDALAYAGDLGIESIDISYASLATDMATLRAPSSYDIPYGTMVAIHYAGTRRFLGRCVRSVVTASGADSYRTIRLAGPWEWMERIPYRQSWQVWIDDALGPTLTSRVILHQDAAGDPVTVEAQLAAIVACAVARGAPIAMGAATVGLTLPWDEQRDVSCATAVMRCLRFAPDVSSWIDYSATTPTVNFGQGSPVSLPASAEADVAGYRDDLVLPGITIEIERTHTVTTDEIQGQYRTLEYLTAGTPAAVDAAFATLQLAGSNVSRSALRIDVVTEAVPDPLTNAAWWVARHPRLKNILAADVSFIQADRFLLDGAIVEDAVDYPRISLTPLADLSAISVNARVERFQAVVDVLQRDDAGEIIDAEHGVELALDVVTTNAVTREYRVPQSYAHDDPEPTPSNLATQLLAHFSVRYAEGSATWPARDLWAYPGGLIASTPIQTVHLSSASKLLEATFGPPSHLAVADFASLLQGFRTRRASVSWKARQDGEPAADQEIAAGQVGPPRAGGHAPGGKRRLVIAGEDAGKIDLNPAPIDSDDTIRVRTISWKDEEDRVQTAQVLATDHIAQDGTTPPPEETPPPPCGHPGNEPGAGGIEDDEHPGDDLNVPDHGDDTTDHPGDIEGENGVTPICGGTP